MLEIKDIKQLLKQTKDQPVFSLYLQVDAALRENQSETPAWRIFAKNALNDVENNHVTDDQHDTWQGIRKRVEDYLADYDPQSKGLVLFFGAEFDTQYELPLRPTNNTCGWPEIIVSPLIWLIDEYEKYLVVLVDSEQANLMTTYLGDMEATDTLESDRFAFDFREKTRPGNAAGTQGDVGTQQSGNDRDRFDDKIDDYINRFHKRVAERVRELTAEEDTTRIIIGGNERAAPNVESHLPDQLQKSVVGITNIPVNANEKDILTRLLPLAQQHERDQEETLVEAIINQAKAGGRSALGREAVETALEMQQVALLVAPWPPQDAVPDLHDLTIQTMECGGHVEFVRGKAASQVHDEGGIIARLHMY